MHQGMALGRLAHCLPTHVLPGRSFAHRHRDKLSKVPATSPSQSNRKANGESVTTIVILRKQATCLKGLKT